MSLSRRSTLCTTAACLIAGIPARATGADALSPIDELWHDPQRTRDLPVRLRWPAAASEHVDAAMSLVLFSHGLGGTVAGGEVWGEAWANAGFAVLHIQHPGSDLEAVRGVASSFADRRNLQVAATPQQLLARLRDIRFVLNEIEQRCASAPSHSPWQKVRSNRIGMSGHSFGAHTALAMAGQKHPLHAALDEPRLAAFIAFSPALPKGPQPSQALSGIARPLLCVTGTLDNDVLGTGATAEQRMALFSALPPGHKAQLVLDGADHMTFAGQTGQAFNTLPRAPVSRELQTRHHAEIAAITADWWRATLRGDASARQRLLAPAGLRPGDRWQQG